MIFMFKGPSVKRFWVVAGRISPVFFVTMSLFVFNVAWSQDRPIDYKIIHVKFIEKFAPRAIIDGSSARAGVSEVDQVSEKHHALSIERIFPDAGIYEAAHQAYGLHLWYEIRFKKDVLLEEALRDYQNLDYFYNVEECQEYTANWENEDPPPSLLSGTNDPMFSNQWHFANTGQSGGKSGADINLLKAWQKETGSRNVIVAIIDGGINLSHPDLVGALWTNNDEIPGNGVDDDGNGYVDDVHGYGFGDKGPALYAHDHGTHVAGTIGAVSNNGIGVSGIAGGSGSADGVRLMSCAVFGKFTNGGFEAAMVYAADNGAVISQNSWGGGSTAIEAAIDYFVNRAGYDNSAANFLSNIQIGPMAGGLVIFAAGNSNSSDRKIGYPASYVSAIAVASTNDNDVKSAFSNFGTWVDISAPGTNILSTVGNDYAFLSGTSMACPQVSGVAALVASHLQRTGLTAKEVWNRIRHSAHPIAYENPTFIGMLGSGRLDAFGSLQEPDNIPPSPIADLHAVSVHYSSIVLGWTATGESGVAGQATEYEIRYSTAPITKSNFLNATRILNPPTPPMSGELVTFTLSNLPLSTKYYFAIKSRDLFNNTSEISNIISATTLSPNIPVVMTPLLTEQLYTGGIASRNIEVKNTAAVELSVRLGVPDLSPAPVGLPTGATGTLFAINFARNVIEELNPKTGGTINSIPLPELLDGGEGLAYDGSNLYYSTYHAVYKLNPKTGDVLYSFPLTGVSRVVGLAWSGRYLYASVELASGYGYRIYEIDSDDGRILRTISSVPFFGLTSSGKDGIFFSCSPSQIYEINMATGSVIREIPFEGHAVELAYSQAENVILVSNGSYVKAIHPVTGEILYLLPNTSSTSLASDEYKNGWLRSDGQVVNVAPGATANIPVEFVATGLTAGQWSGTINVIPLDAHTSPIPVPVSLTVIEGADIELVNELDFGTQYIGTAIDTIILVENRGFSELNVTDIQSNNSQIVTSHQSLTVPAGQKVALTISIVPSGVGLINSSLTFSSNDPDEGSILIPVHADIMLPPDIEVTPTALNTTLASGESKILNFTAKNTGGSVLRWKANFAGSAAPWLNEVPAPSGINTPNELEPPATTFVDDFTLKASSPEALTCLSHDPQSGSVYGKSLSGQTFYRYDLATDRWTVLGLTPESLYGQAAYLDGKIYNAGSQLGVYMIETNVWSTVQFPIQAETGSLTSDGQYIYLTLGHGQTSPSGGFYRYDPGANTWLRLADVPGGIGLNGGLSYHGGVVFCHEDGTTGFTGDGNTAFFKYYTASDTWIKTTSIPGKVNAGSAIDPSSGRYFVMGTHRFSMLDIREGEWALEETPFSIGSFSGLVFVGTPGYSGIYFTQGGETGFSRFETPPASEWIIITPSQGDLAPGATQNFSVEVKARGMDGGVYKGNLRLSSRHPSLQKAIPLTATVLGVPDISIDLASGDVGEVHIGKVKGVLLTIKNNGTAPLLVPSITSDKTDFTVSTPSLTLQTGESTTLNVYFMPSTIGAQTGIFTFHNNDPDEGSIQFVLKGFGVYPPVGTVTPNSLSVNLFSGGTSIQKITISNTGGSNMDYYIDIPYGLNWVKGASYGDLAPGETKIIDITIDASGKPSGTYNTKIGFRIHEDDVSDVPIVMVVTSAPDLWTSTENLDFGNRFVNGTYDSAVQIKNNGVLPLAITSITTDNEAYGIAAATPINLAPGEILNATIHFTPTTISTQTGQIKFVSNDPDEALYVLPLAGTGVGAPIVSSGVATLNESALTNESSTQTLTVTNSGGSDLKWQIKAYSNPYPDDPESGPTIPSDGGKFSSKSSTAYELMALTVNPSSGDIIAQASIDEALYSFNPSTGSWTRIGRTPAFKHKSGGAVFLNSKMYSVYSSDNSNMLVYNFTLQHWTPIPHNLGSGTGTITTDGVLLYVAGGGKFKSYDPKTRVWTDLALPNFTLDGAGGLSYHNGSIFAHAGHGQGFARYDLLSRTWESLVPVPGEAVLGSAIDPENGRYYAYGKSSSYNYLYEYDMTARLWNVMPIALFAVSDGGLAYTSKAGGEGIYFIRGKSGIGFARYEPKAELPWLRVSPMIGQTKASESQTIGVNYNAYNLNTGTYEGLVQVVSNDPLLSTLDIPVTFHVTNPGPAIEIPQQISATIERSTPYVTQYKIENKGQGMLQWSLASILPDGMAISKASGDLSGFSYEYIDISFDARLFGPDILDYMLEISSNDAFNPTVATVISISIITNHAPVGFPIASQTLTSSLHIDLLDIFFDEDNDPLEFTISSSNPDVASTTLTGTTLSVYPIGAGSATITATATDIYNFSATSSFTVTVKRIVTGVELIPTEPPLDAIPNPFDASVTISYYVDNPGVSAIAILDVSGKIVWQVPHYAEVFGKNEIEIDGTQLSPGIYHCRLVRADNKISTTRLVKY